MALHWGCEELRKWSFFPTNVLLSFVKQFFHELLSTLHSGLVPLLLHSLQGLVMFLQGPQTPTAEVKGVLAGNLSKGEGTPKYD